jgi:hypothetical protein
MPPRYAYWTILVDDRPTAFRAATREDLLPTFEQIRRKHPTAVMRWFARGRIWESPAHAAREERAPRERRDRNWRPGGNHRDPRARFEEQRKARNAERRRERFRHRADAGRPGAGAGERPRDRRQETRRPDKRQGGSGRGARPRPHDEGSPDAWREGPRNGRDRNRPGPHTRRDRERREGRDRQGHAPSKPGDRMRGPGRAPSGAAPQSRPHGRPPRKDHWRDRPPGHERPDREGRADPRRSDEQGATARARRDRQSHRRDRFPRPDRRRGQEPGTEGPPPGPDRPPRPGQEPPPVPARSEEIVIPPSPPERGRTDDVTGTPPGGKRDNER